MNTDRAHKDASMFAFSLSFSYFFRIDNQYAEFDKQQGRTLVEGGGESGKGKMADSCQMKDMFLVECLNSQIIS